MKLPEPVVVPEEKLLRYLLLPREENDKSRFLAAAGYRLANRKTLEEDLRQLAATEEVTASEGSPYGVKYEVAGTLTGPKGQRLEVLTIWIRLEASAETRFITLVPRRGRRP